ncbi:MAG: putative Tic20 family protein, partial [Akkermansiaceae bacterium]
YLVGFIFTIIAALKANDGVAYRYPLTIRFIK